MAEKVIEYSRMLTLGNRLIFKNNTSEDGNKDKVKLIDRDWMKSAFMVPDEDIDSDYAQNRYFSTAQLKFTDTTLGGNIGINSRPQFTRYADLRVQGRRMDRGEVTVPTRGNIGMGRYYSEAIDDNSQNLYLEFGVPKFNSLFTFFTRSIDYKTSVIAASGRSPIMYNIGKLVGSIAVFLAFPLISVAIWGIKALKDVILGDESFNYYYLDPTMHVYWSTVNTIVSSMSTEMGILIPEFINKGGGGPSIGTTVKVNQADLHELHLLMPNIFTDSNFIDVFAIANKAQAMANHQLDIERKTYEANKNNDGSYLPYANTQSSKVSSQSKGGGFSAWLNSVMSVSNNYEFVDPKAPKEKDKIETPSDAKVDLVEKGVAPGPDGTYKQTEEEAKKNHVKGVGTYFDAAFRGGINHAIFKVDFVGSLSESFSNSVTDVPAGDKLKSLGKSAREMKFSLGGGAIAGDAVKAVTSAATDMLAGALDGMTFGLSNIIPTLFGGAYIDIPKMWDDSSASLPKITYTMQLISPYGNTISQLQNLYIPLAMLLAGALPLSTGNSSYTSPFICKSFLKGVQSIQLGMITDLSITRGTSNLAYNKQKKVLALDVSFTITDFSSLMTAPIDPGLFGGFTGGVDSGSVFGRYISTLASRDLLTDTHAMSKAKIRMSRLKFGADAATSPAYWGSRMGNFAEGFLGGLVADHSLSLQDRN